jgi:ubiquinone/menaquinone biosynthesis C-methylase UbiE
VIDPKDVIRKYSVEELSETADEYYRVVTDPTPLMSKPFTFLHEAPEALQNLGLLLSGLHLGKTMTVLDFGGGTGWLSRFLTQLNCQVICCDVSEAALDIGRRLFAEHPLIGTVVFQPRFLRFDGHHLDLPDASVDRAVCFDAFHHVPNQAEVLRELGRVLTPGGIAGFSEPGRNHSRSPQSQYEMQNHRVLENDIVLPEIFKASQAAGFTDMVIKVVSDNMEMSLTDLEVLNSQGPEEHAARESLRSEIWNQTYNGMHNRSIFFLRKGALRRDSRHHVGLAHRLSVGQQQFTGRAGESVAMTFRVTNTGEAHWLHTNSEIFGIVRLASHLYDGNKRLLAIDHSRHDLPQAVAPGETIEVPIRVDLPGAGTFVLGFDLVAEGVTWFENVGSTPVYVTVDMS